MQPGKTVNGGRSSVGRAPDCDSGGRGFETHRPPHLQNGPLAQLVEQWTLNPLVEGSNPSWPTNKINELSIESPKPSRKRRVKGGKKMDTPLSYSVTFGADKPPVKIESVLFRERTLKISVVFENKTKVNITIET